MAEKRTCRFNQGELYISKKDNEPSMLYYGRLIGLAHLMSSIECVNGWPVSERPYSIPLENLKDVFEAKPGEEVYLFYASAVINEDGSLDLKSEVKFKGTTPSARFSKEEVEIIREKCML